MRNCVLVLTASALFIGTATMAAGVNGDTTRPITPGTYHCKAGPSRMMLTLGDIEISGMNFTFTGPTGETSSGTYATGPDQYMWTGDIGPIKASQIVDSGRNGDADNSFWFMYKARPEESPTSASCS